MNLIKIEPFTRINDNFIRSSLLDATPVAQDILHPLITSGPSGGANSTHFQADFYQHVALDIVAETVFHYPYPRICEKTLRPMNCKRMFVIVGPAHCLRLLHDKGFETFGDIIDENYDTIDDPEQRLLAVARAIEQFCAIDLEQIKSYYVNNRAKFDHNWHTMKNLLRNEVEAFAKEHHV